MVKKYDHKKIEKKWQKYWQKKEFYKAKDFDKKPKKYVLDMFPYPSGEGLHVGHVLGYTATDIVSRYLRMKGYNVLHPMGWDAFGLPAENYAIKNKIHPKIAVDRNIKRFKKQLLSLGFGYDWDREINTTDPEYYKWTQWIFLKLYEKGLAYEAMLPINWCPSCQTGLANEEVVDGHCERCGSEVTKRNLRQWVLRITAYADRLLKDLDELDWPEKIKLMQRNWIGRSEGAIIRFRIQDLRFKNEFIEVFTTRPDTLFGATYLVLAPEYPLVEKITTKEQRGAVEIYVDAAKKKSELERTELIKEKTGVFTGAYAINPVNNEKIPIWIADYVLASYGTGAIMAVPAHDQRDFEFAKKYNLPIRIVICPEWPPQKKCPLLTQAYEEEGYLTDSGQFTGTKSEKAKEEIVEWLSKRGLAKKAVNYKLRDWIFSRQRYWGEPIPIIKCPKCGNVPLSEKDLPLKLPKVKKYEPTGTGESPLVNIKFWVDVNCPKCGGPAQRETNTMPQWAGSCWYYLAFALGKKKLSLEEKYFRKIIDYWLPVDLYVGGVEHAVLHLLYARFWHKFLYDIGVVSTKEPFQKLVNQGLILAPDGKKMSKSLGNVINPDDVVKKFGADSIRMYEMFMGPLEDSKPWDTHGIIGIYRFLNRVWNLKNKIIMRTSDAHKLKNNIRTSDVLNKKLHQTIKKMTEDIENFRFNTGISAMMVLVNEMEKEKELTVASYQLLLTILSPFAPHIAEELWQMLGNKKSIQLEKWPKYDEKLIIEDKKVIVVEVNGKVRAQIEMLVGASQKDVEKSAKENESVKKYLEGKTIKKVIYVEDRIINFVI